MTLPLVWCYSCLPSFGITNKINALSGLIDQARLLMRSSWSRSCQTMIMFM
jgi:hypothetical protein